MAKKNPKYLKYASTHEWIKVENNIGTCGITDHAQHLLTDIVFVELPENGKKYTQAERIAVVESVKSVSDIYAPVTGEVVAVNDQLSGAPELINNDAYGAGWIFKIAISDPKELEVLLSQEEYEKTI
jgi:glycine cleavage system H protein